MRTIDEIAATLLSQGATDIFLTEGQFPRYRMATNVYVAEMEVVTEAAMQAFWAACGANPAEGFDYDKRYHVRGADGYVRANLYQSLGKLCVALRPIKNVIPEMEELRLPSEVLRSWFSRDSGLILVTGATGSGKSTTVASALQDLSRSRQGHILTIEDPIEYIFQNDQSFFSQREVLSDTENFAKALRASLRQNPDVVFVGEIRDEETASIALRSAESGHLVAATLHSAGAVEALERLTLLFPEGSREGARHLYSQQLIGIASQALLKSQEGGLVPIVELMENDGATRKWLIEGKYPELRDLIARDDGQVSVGFLSSLVKACRSGLIDIEVARAAARNPHDFDRAISGFN